MGQTGRLSWTQEQNERITGCSSFIHLWVMFFLFYLDRLNRRLQSSSGAPHDCRWGASSWLVCQIQPSTTHRRPVSSGGESSSDSGHNTVIYMRRRWKELDGTLTSLNHTTGPFSPLSSFSFLVCVVVLPIYLFFPPTTLKNLGKQSSSCWKIPKILNLPAAKPWNCTHFTFGCWWQKLTAGGRTALKHKDMEVKQTLAVWNGDCSAAG